MIISIIIILTLIVLSFIFSDYNFTDRQISTLKIVSYVCLGSVVYCFVIGEISRNNSQMDKLWSILPIAYAWIITIKGDFKIRLLVMAILITLWGIRLTYNFGRKGAYKLKFWEGEEDYRWAVLRKKPFLNTKVGWALFDLFFISFYQNVLVLGITLPMIASMESNISFGIIDILATLLTLGFLVIEVIADKEQWNFQETKKKYLKEGKTLNELDLPYSLGFNTVGLWKVMRHPNYLGEQGFWLSLYVFVIASGMATYYLFNITLIFPLILVFLFIGSSTFGEMISSSKYPKYSQYQKQVFKYLPIRKFNPNE